MSALPEPYYDRDGITIYHGDARQIVRHNRHYVGVDISDEYLDLARERINGIQRGFPWEAA